MLSLQKTASSERLAGLDHLRALAIIMVFLFHYPEQDAFGVGARYVDFFWSGVDLFFVLSGYLITSHLLKTVDTSSSVPYKEFYIKRIFRIVPVYMIVVGIYFLVPGFAETTRPPAPLWKFLTFTQNFDLPGGQFSHAWSLCVEEQFYLLFPLIIVGLLYLKILRKGIYVLVLLFVATILIRLCIWNIYIVPKINADVSYVQIWLMKIYYPTYSRLDGLLTGISIALLFRSVPAFKTKMSKFGNLFLLAGIAAIVAAFFICAGEKRIGFYGSVYGFAIISLAYGLIVIAALLPGCVLYKFSSRITSGIAMLSYAMYLIHKGVTHICRELYMNRGGESESIWILLISFAVTICCALVLRYVVETPAVKLRDKLLAKKTSAASPE